MRRDHRPAWLRDAWNAYEAWWTRRFLAPQFDALGPRPVVVRPWFVEVFGAGVRVGADLSALAGADARIRLTTWPAPGGEAAITLGDATLLTGGVRLLAAKEVTVGDGCLFAHRAVITDCDWHGLYDRLDAAKEARPVRLGDNVWVGDGAYIGKGVTIGDHAVVAARSVVVKDVPAFAVVAGVPAKVVKKLDPETPRRTRMDLYATPGMEAYFNQAWRRLHGRNTLLDWMRSKLAPTRDD